MCFSSSAVRRPAALGRCGKSRGKRGGWFTSAAPCWMSTLSLQIAKLRGSLRNPPINGPPSHVPIRNLLFNKAAHKEELCVSREYKRLHRLYTRKSSGFPRFQYFSVILVYWEEKKTGMLLAKSFQENVDDANLHIVWIIMSISTSGCVP